MPPSPPPQPETGQESSLFEQLHSRLFDVFGHVPIAFVKLLSKVRDIEDALTRTGWTEEDEGHGAEDDSDDDLDGQTTAGRIYERFARTGQYSTTIVLLIARLARKEAALVALSKKTAEEHMDVEEHREVIVDSPVDGQHGGKTPAGDIDTTSTSTVGSPQKTVVIKLEPDCNKDDGERLRAAAPTPKGSTPARSTNSERPTGSDSTNSSRPMGANSSKTNLDPNNSNKDNDKVLSQAIPQQSRVAETGGRPSPSSNIVPEASSNTKSSPRTTFPDQPQNPQHPQRPPSSNHQSKVQPNAGLEPSAGPKNTCQSHRTISQTAQQAQPAEKSQSTQETRPTDKSQPTQKAQSTQKSHPGQDTRPSATEKLIQQKLAAVNEMLAEREENFEPAPTTGRSSSPTRTLRKALKDASPLKAPLPGGKRPANNSVSSGSSGVQIRGHGATAPTGQASGSKQTPPTAVHNGSSFPPLPPNTAPTAAQNTSSFWTPPVYSKRPIENPYPELEQYGIYSGYPQSPGYVKMLRKNTQTNTWDWRFLMIAEVKNRLDRGFCVYCGVRDRTHDNVQNCPVRAAADHAMSFWIDHKLQGSPIPEPRKRSFSERVELPFSERVEFPKAKHPRL